MALRTIDIEAESVKTLKTFINGDFIESVKLIHFSEGRVIITGIGKSAIIAQKIVATLNSTGTPAVFMHAADAIHGDLGIIQQHDVVIVISKSGNTPEIKVLVPLLKNGGNKLIAIAGDPQSFLATNANYFLNTFVSREACPNNLAPTSSTTAQLAMGDALAVCLLDCKGFTSSDFARFHPGGALGKRLYLKVADIFPNNQKPTVSPSDSMSNVIMEISSKRLGVTAVVENEKLLGIITDGDLRRMFGKSTDMQSVKASEMMSVNPKTAHPEMMAVDALQIMKQFNITSLVVVEGDKYQGFIHLHDLLREGII
ncbi:MAG: KpsF/GutQ family sugar-phosphate isomerase [Bacteroidia bacterium]|nr:KpsF/GutQ family sugar-phosphate isomerase [Bacteroidota bacterium]MBP9084263.1 KpsF/GutQ family sugar-phosphate isomerase [Bacteroidia bacterium]MBK7968391.1 KpsF/GutQ family sugar-phosphate isomerase [Bacteroidota bacterium]MBK8873425.1 KpsF/GutQ family sugar-phosphate isomerase [Bacteroidota bacterium]MBK9424408.1 KpsF/GutQ family sugar-phosphate isomerase [Bacteroidota bacterium]